MAVSAQVAALLHTLIFFHFVTGSSSTKITIINECVATVWPAILSISTPLSTTGFTLPPGAISAINLPTAWSGRIWGRTLCSQDSAGKLFCLTGDCGSSTLECAGGDVSPQATMAEFTLSSTAGGLDFFDLSLVEGYNLPMMVEHQGGTGAGNCTATGCGVDLNAACPKEQKVMNNGDAVACKNVCEAPGTCEPSFYSEFLSSAYPHTCVSADYLLTFCFKSSIMSENGEYPTAVDSSSKVITLIFAIVSICGLITCKLTVYFKTRNCGMHFLFGISPEESNPNSSSGVV